jgi:hypothetical protein
MSTVEEIVNAVKGLPPREQAEVKRRLETLLAQPDQKEVPVATSQESRGTLRELFGSIDLGYATGADNESIDADLAREYGNTHEEVR